MTTKEKFKIVERSYKHSDNLPIMVGDKIYVCFGGVELHDHNETLQFKDCSEVTDVDENYDGDVKNERLDIYLVNHLWEKPNYLVETIFYEDELIEIIAQ